MSSTARQELVPKTSLTLPPIPILLRLVEDRDFPANRIAGYLKGEHSPRQALAARAACVALEGADVVGFVAGHKTGRYGCDGELEWIGVVRGTASPGNRRQLLRIMAVWFVEQKAIRVCIDPGNATARATPSMARSR